MHWNPGFAGVLVLTLCVFELCAQEFRITAVRLNDEGQLTVTHQSALNYYYLLYQGPSPTNITQVAAMALGQAGSGQLTDPARADGASYYLVRQVPQAQSLDVDGDGLPDVYELQRENYLNPLNPVDARLDYDGDGKSNLQEFRDGSDPADLPPDPAGVVTPLNPSGNTSLADATKFLYTGQNPIQTGVAAGTFDAQRVCVLRGKVRQRDGNVLPGVTRGAILDFAKEASIEVEGPGGTAVPALHYDASAIHVKAGPI